MKKAAFGILASLILVSQGVAQVRSANPSSAVNAPPPSSPAPLAERTVRAEWAELPTSDQMAHFYPPVAQLMQVTGRVRLRCHVTAGDTLDQCKVVSEIPKGLGFADAGLLLAPYFHLHPRPAAEKTDADFTNVPLRFALPEPEPIPPEPGGPAPSLRSLTLARRLAAVVAGNADEAAAEAMGQTRNRLEGEVSDSVLATPETQKALEALEQSWRAAFPAFKEQLAQSFARIYTVQDLARIVTFMESPVGRRWQSRKKQASEMHAAAWERLWREAETQASIRLCKEILCSNASASRPATAAPLDPQ